MSFQECFLRSIDQEPMPDCDGDAVEFWLNFMACPEFELYREFINGPKQKCQIKVSFALSVQLNGDWVSSLIQLLLQRGVLISWSGQTLKFEKVECKVLDVRGLTLEQRRVFCYTTRKRTRSGERVTTTTINIDEYIKNNCQK